MYLLNQTIDELPGLMDTHAGLRHGDLGRTPFDKFKVLNSKRRMCNSCAAPLLTATCSMCRVLSPCVRDIVGTPDKIKIICKLSPSFLSV